MIDSQSAKTTERGGPRGYDAGKNIKGPKRHIITDTAGHLVAVQVHSGSRWGTGVAGLDPVPVSLAASRLGGHAGDKLATALDQHGEWRIEIVKRSDHATGFHLLPRRWVVERTFAWLNRNRRLAKDFEATPSSGEAWIYLASIQLLARRLAQPATYSAHASA